MKWMNAARGARLVLVLLLTLAVAMLPAQTMPVNAEAVTVTTSTTFPINISVFVSCANGGAGEVVALSGSLHDLIHVTMDGNGGFHLTTHDNPQGVSGTGLKTGTKYQGTGVTRSDAEITAGGTFERTFVNNFRIIGQGPGNNYLVHENLHVTINPDGTVTSYHDNFGIECR